MVVSGLPAVSVVGLMLVRVGTGLLNANVCGADVPPPGAELTTVIAVVPTAADAACGRIAVNCVELTNVVVRLVVPENTLEPLTKPVPVKVMVASGPPITSDVGLIEVNTGAGLLMGNV